MEDTIIGMWTDYYDSDLISLKEFAIKIKQEELHWTLDEYCDGRKNTNLQWFRFDPFDGKKISRTSVKEYVNEFLKK